MDNNLKTYENNLVDTAIDIINKGYNFLEGVNDVAQKLNVSKHHLIREFSKTIGISPGKYLEQVRVECAKQILLTTDYPLDIVAGIVGFSGANYFCRVFKKTTNQTPTEYRKSDAKIARDYRFKDILTSIEDPYFV